MKRILVITLAVGLSFGAAASATDLNLTCEAEGCDSSTITVGPGCEVNYLIIGELSDDTNRGLAAVVVDLSFDGGALSQANEPTELPMLNFAPSAGLANPDGFGGTIGNGGLLQVGGSQNTIANGQWVCTTDDDCPGDSTCVGELCTAIPGLPLGTLITDVAEPGSPVVLVTGMLTAPAIEGTYTLELTNLAASVVEQGSVGIKFWSTQQAGTGAITNLSITVEEGAGCCDSSEACCLPNGTCITANGVDCAENLGGEPQGLGSECAGDPDGDGVDGTCGDQCPADPEKTEPGACGCGVPDVDDNGNGVIDCLEVEGIPTVSQWGLVILALVLLTAAKLSFRRRAGQSVKT